MAAMATTGSTMGSTYQTQAIPQDLTTAINMFAANQQSLYQHIAPLMQQMAAMLFQAQQSTQDHQHMYQEPPIHHLAIPSQNPFAGNGGNYQGFNQGWGGRSTGRRNSGQGSNRC
jgi:hypothetical protein